MSDDAKWLQRAVDLAAQNVADGGGPFGAVVVSADGELLADGQNRVTRDLDPTAHAEVTAIRAACLRISDFSLAGATLYASCEPCPMCLASALWSRVDRIVYTADRHQAEVGGFDDRAFYDLFNSPSISWQAPKVEHVPTLTSNHPFEAWQANAARTDY